MNQVDGVSDMVLLPCDSVLGRAQKRENSQYLASGVVSGMKLSTSPCPDVRHFSFSPYASGALPTAALVLEPKRVNQH